MISWPDKTDASRLPAASTPLSPTILSGLVGIIDGFCVSGTGFIIFLTYVGWWAGNSAYYLSAIAVATFMTIAAFYVSDLYTFQYVVQWREQLKRVPLVCTIVFLLLATMAFALKSSAQYSRVWAFSWFLSSVCSICIVRASICLLLQKWARAGRLTRNVVIVGAGKQAKRLLVHMEQVSEPWIRVVGIFDDRIHRTGPKLLSYHVLGNVDDLLVFSRTHRIDDIVIALPWDAEQRVPKIVEELQELPVHLHLGSDLIGFRYPHAGYGALGGVNMLDIASKPIVGVETGCQDVGR